MAYVYPGPSDIQELTYNSSKTENALYFDYTYQGAIVAGSLTAEIQLMKPNGDSIGSTAAMTASASQLSYSVDTTTTSTYIKDIDYIADIASTYLGSITATHRIYFDVVAKRLNVVLTQDHLLETDPGLVSLLPSGETDFSKYLNGAWREIRAYIRSHGFRPALLLDSYTLLIPHKHRVLAMFYKYASTEADDHWWQLFVYHEEKFHESLAAALSNAKYDESENGIPEGMRNIRQVQFHR